MDCCRPVTARLVWLVALAALIVGCDPGYEFNGDVASSATPPTLVGTNWDGEAFDLESLHGHVVIVFFGYTYCPDICPMTLHKMSQLREQLGASAEELEVVFASVDPHRDTVEKLSQYVPNFDSQFYGLHLDFDQLDAAKESFNLTVQYGQPEDGPGTDSYYYVDHTGFYFVLDRSGKLRVTFPPNATVELFRPDIEYLLGS